MLHWVEGDIWQANVSVLTDRDFDPKGLKPMRVTIIGTACIYFEIICFTLSLFP